MKERKSRTTTVPVEEKNLVENPTVYSPDKIHSFYKKLILIEVFGKCVVFLSSFPPWGSVYVTEDQKHLSFLGFMMLLSTVDIYYVLFLSYKKDEVPCKRRIWELFLRPATYMAAANIVTKIVLAKEFWKVPHTNQLFDRYSGSLGSFHYVRPHFTLFLIIVDIIFLTCGICYCLNRYKPLKNVRYYQKTRENRQNGGNLSILDSRSFKIIISNVGDSEMPNLKLNLSRRVTTAHAGCCGLFKNRTESVHFTVVIPMLRAQESVTLIPETHFQEGAVRVPRFRAFGYDVGERVETTIEQKKNKAKLVEEFVKTNGEIYVGEEICPKWSRAATNPNYMRTLM